MFALVSAICKEYLKSTPFSVVASHCRPAAVYLGLILLVCVWSIFFSNLHRQEYTALGDRRNSSRLISFTICHEEEKAQPRGAFRSRSCEPSRSMAKEKNDTTSSQLARLERSFSDFAVEVRSQDYCGGCALCLWTHLFPASARRAVSNLCVGQSISVLVYCPIALCAFVSLCSCLFQSVAPSPCLSPSLSSPLPVPLLSFFPFLSATVHLSLSLSVPPLLPSPFLSPLYLSVSACKVSPQFL